MEDQKYKTPKVAKIDNISLKKRNGTSKKKTLPGAEYLERRRADQRGEGFDSEEGDLVDLGPEDHDLRLGNGTMELRIAGC